MNNNYNDHISSTAEQLPNTHRQRQLSLRPRSPSRQIDRSNDHISKSDSINSGLDSVKTNHLNNKRVSIVRYSI